MPGTIKLKQGNKTIATRDYKNSKELRKIFENLDELVRHFYKKPRKTPFHYQISQKDEKIN